MCRCVLLTVLWLLIRTRWCLLIVGLLSIAEPLFPSRCLLGTILVTLCLMVWDWWVSRAEPMLSCWHDLLFHFVFGLIECSHSLLALHSGLQLLIIIIIMIKTYISSFIVVYVIYFMHSLYIFFPSPEKLKIFIQEIYLL